MNVAILTNFQDFNPGYSLTSIVQDQIEMLTRHGNKVHLFVCEVYNEAFDPPWPKSLAVHKVTPFGDLIDYKKKADMSKEHYGLAEKTRDVLNETFNKLNIDIAFTHDWIFTGWNLPYARGIAMATGTLRDIRWLHWVHSVPSQKYDWWKIKEYGKQHKIIFPNSTDALRVAEAFQGELEDVRVIPHIKDLRTFYGFHTDTCKFIDDYPNVMQADIVQIYPASTDRLRAKGIDILCDIFGAIKERGLKVCLVIANQWATGKDRKESLDKYYKLAARKGLSRDSEFIFTSEWDKRFETGIPRSMLRELLLCSNLFIFPTMEESFGLVGPEAALAGNFMVLNYSLYMMREVFGGIGLYHDFGSFHNAFTPPHKDYYKELSTIILGRMYNNEAVRTKTFCRKTYNMDALYLNIYEPLMMESETWLDK